MKTGKLLLLVALGQILLPSKVFADGPPEYVRFARDIIVERGETTGDLVCLWCSIRLGGRSEGDVVAVGGSVEADGDIAGDSVAVGGYIRLGPGVHVAGDAVALGGYLERGPGSSVAGDPVSVPWFYMPGQRQLVLQGAPLFLFGSLALILLVAAILRQKRLQAMASAVHEHPGPVFLASVALWTGMSLLFILFDRFGSAGELLSGVLGVALGVTGLVGFVGLCARAGSRLVTNWAPTTAVVVGGMILTLLQIIPVAGLFVFLALAFIAPGCALYTGFGTSKDWLWSGLLHPPRPISGTRGAGSTAS